MPPSEILKRFSNAKAELIEANSCKIIVKIISPAQEILIEHNSIKLSKTKNARKRPKHYNHEYFQNKG